MTPLEVVTQLPEGKNSGMFFSVMCIMENLEKDLLIGTLPLLAMVNPYNEYNIIFTVESYKDKWSKEIIKGYKGAQVISSHLLKY